MGLETFLLQSSQKFVVEAPGATLPLPVAQGDGPAIPGFSGTSAKSRKYALTITASTAATTLTGAAVFVWIDGGWRKHSLIANPTFAAGDLSSVIVIDNVIGDNIAVAGTVGGGGTIGVVAYPIESNI